jgi:DNA-binding NarL/FixJ family response regulator
MTDPIRILIADDHTMFRQGLREILERKGGFRVVAEARDGLEAVELARLERPDIALLDITMTGIDGVEATRRIAALGQPTRVVMLTMHRDDRLLLEALRAGANAYLLKDAEASELVSTLRAVARGDAVLEPTATARVLDELRRAASVSPADQLTERERDILALVARGADNRAIAQQLHLSEKTIANRLSEIFSKLGVSNRTQAALVAVQRGLVRPPDDA